MVLENQRRKGCAESRANSCCHLAPVVQAVGSPKPAGVSSSSPVAGPVPRARRWEAGGSDDLNLAGLLNVLDGVVDTPGRLLVLSTNHPEMLDPALIRPGRINR